jgi:5-methylthioribose kinase
MPDPYRILKEADLRDYLSGLTEVATRLGGRASDWTISEVGDGNLNLVFIIKGSNGGIAVKQALPYVRLVGESWPLPLSRSHYEYLALTHQARVAPGLVPAVLHQNEPLALVAMELIEPHIIMRKGLVAGTIYPRFVEDITTFLARTLFLSSDLALPAAARKEGIAAFAGNHALCKITEDLIFTDPYRIAEQNRWTSPWLDDTAAAFRDDFDAHVAISRLKLKFMGSPEALIHGDLHTGSIMVTEGETRVIDPEFAFYGPMGFDIGAVIGNLLMAYLASPGHEVSAGERRVFEAWLLSTVEQVWADFARKFLALWRGDARGDAYPVVLFAGAAGAARLEAERQAYMSRLFADTVGFAAAKTIRRILGLAHNIDFELIEDERIRAVCEARSLRLAREMLVNTASFANITAVTSAAREVRDWRPDFAR